MSNQENFVAYEYKNISVKRDSVALYEDCLKNFGWTLIEQKNHGFVPAQVDVNPHQVETDVTAYSTVAAPETVDEADVLTLKFKRNRRLLNKREIDKLERQCEDALRAIEKLEKKNSARVMGVSLGTGIIGTAFLGLATFQFVAGSLALGIVFAVVGVAGWAFGFFANRKIGNKKAAQAEPVISQQLDEVYRICEAAHALLA